MEVWNLDAVFGIFMEILLATALLEGVFLIYDQEQHFKKICYCFSEGLEINPKGPGPRDWSLKLLNTN
jgi:hypothetical protein